MAGGAQWEVVGGKTKKKSKVPVLNKDNMSNVLLSGPISESTTIYNAFLEKALSGKDVPKEKKVTNDLPKQMQKNVQKKKKTDKKATSPKLSFDEAFQSVTVEDVKGHLETLGLLSPDNPLLWLKELASFLNVNLDVPVEDPIFSSKPSGYPANLLNKGVYKEIVKVFSKCTPQMLKVLYEFCLTAMVQDMLKGLSGAGYRTMCQCLGQESPAVVRDSLVKCLELCNNHVNRPPICLSIMWAAGQAGNKNLEIGFQVWTELMFPMIVTKSLVSYAVEYVEKLVHRTERKCTKSLIGVKDYFPLLDLVYSKEFNKGPVQKKLLTLLPSLKSLSYGPEPQNVLRLYFPSYLVRLEPQCPPALKEEILSSLLHCLEVDSRCYSIWRQLYTKNFAQSKVLITYINDQRQKLSSKFPRSLLLETLSVFQVTNEDLVTNRKKDSDLKECINITQQLLNHLRKNLSNGRKWLLITFALSVIVLLALVRYDIVTHGSFAKSKTGRWMKQYGILAALNQAAEKLSYFYGKIHKLMVKYLPSVVAWGQSTLLPAIESFLSALGAALLSAWEGTERLRVVCAKNLPIILQKVDSTFGEYAPKLWSATSKGITVLSTYVITGFNILLESSNSALSFLQSSPQLMNVVTAVQRNCGALVEYVQQYTVYAITLVQSYIPT